MKFYAGIAVVIVVSYLFWDRLVVVGIALSQWSINMIRVVLWNITWGVN